MIWFGASWCVNHQLSRTLAPWAHHHQDSEKLGIWGILFPDKAKSHGQFGPKTTYETDRQTYRKQADIQTGRLTERLTDK